MAGACATILKAAFDGSMPWSALAGSLRQSSPDGLGLGMGMAAGAKASPPMAASVPVNLAPGETRAIDLDAWAERMQPGGDAIAGEMLNWSARYEGDSSDLLLTAGSVDGSGSYVFQVVPRQLAASAGEQLPYWSTAEGDNTMYSLWNPGETVQDMVLHLTGADGAGDYEIALHLAPGASAMVDLGMIRAEGMPDMHGHLLPASATGSAMLEPGGKPMPGPDGVIVVPKGGLWSMQVIVSTGVFNPTTATCGDPCGSCCGYELPQVSADFPGGDGEIGSTLYAQFEIWDCTGYPMNDSLNANWTASSGLSFVAVGSDDATFTALAVGQQWVTADDYISVVPDPDFVCIRFCEKGDLTNTGYADVVATDQCGDLQTPTSGSRGYLMSEYADYGVDLSPSCSDFNNAASSAYFSHAELTVNDESTWSLIRGPLTIASSAGYGLDAWRVDYGGARTTTSVYRTPAHNWSVGGTAQSRHMYGDAADLLNQSGTIDEWNAMIKAADTNAGHAQADYEEPESGPCGTACAHADWRSHTGGYSH